MCIWHVWHLVITLRQAPSHSGSPDMLPKAMQFPFLCLLTLAIT